MVGWADSCAMRFGLWLAVTDGEGNLQWQRCYAPEKRIWYHFPTAVIQLADGNFIVAGEGCWLLCVSEAGDLLWSRTYDAGECRVLVHCKDGGFLLAGIGQKTPQLPNKGGWILKTDSLGQEQWRRTFESGFTAYIYDATVSVDGRIIAVGEAYDENHPDSRESDGWVVILDSTGNVIRNEIFGKSIGIRFSHVWNAPNEGFLLHGQTTVPKVQPWVSGDEILMRISASGDSLWSRGRKEGWEADSGAVDTDGKLPHRYFDDVLGVEPPSHVSHLISGAKMRSHNFWDAAGLAPGGYFYAGGVTLSADSSKTK
jgi:hypothetical protein